ncbi:pre-mRNA-splicing factor CWC22 homolog isoform X1 [Nilaparvata lugens]|uniref:pre-mRNA-splicing factor CWC22 homolog isoform X1 n=1 Tax=Nilaparvata lugens TaxID=108931 RepID=UPI00193CEAEA|nr:pre-mRNA-splicing factor CWC22 homolog isoform X1 [Nilaparvata lugens]XP_022194025.2 pre-mRNA-splicing factor CWC22 homolog isoform X1 [Nilaparvata lugens]
MNYSTLEKRHNRKESSKHDKLSSSFHSYHDGYSRKKSRDSNRERGKVSDDGDNKTRETTQKAYKASHNPKNHTLPGDVKLSRNIERNIRTRKLRNENPSLKVSQLQRYANRRVFEDPSDLDIITIKGPNITIKPCTSIDSMKSINPTVGCGIGRCFPVALQKSMRRDSVKGNNRNGHIDKFIRENFSILEVNQEEQRNALLKKSEETDKRNARPDNEPVKILKKEVPLSRRDSHVRFSNEITLMSSGTDLQDVRKGHDYKRVKEDDRKSSKRITHDEMNRKERKKAVEQNYRHRRKNSTETSTEPRNFSMTREQFDEDSGNKKICYHLKREVSNESNFGGRRSSMERRESKENIKKKVGVEKSSSQPQKVYFLRRRNRLNGGKRFVEYSKKTRNQTLNECQVEKKIDADDVKQQELRTRIMHETKSEEDNDGTEAKPDESIISRTSEKRNGLNRYFTFDFFRGRSEKDFKRERSGLKRNRDPNRILQTREEKMNEMYTSRNDNKQKQLNPPIIINSNRAQKKNNLKEDESSSKNNDRKREEKLENFKSNHDSELHKSSRQSIQIVNDKQSGKSKVPLKFLRKILGRRNIRHKNSTSRIERNISESENYDSKRRRSMYEKRTTQKIKTNGRSGSSKSEKEKKYIKVEQSNENNNNMRKVSFFIANSLFNNIASSQYWQMGSSPVNERL